MGELLYSGSRDFVPPAAFFLRLDPTFDSAMHLLYLDDSGAAQNANEDYLVLGGISVFERQVFWLSEELERLAAAVDPQNPDEVEFHASEVFSGRIAPWKTMSRDRRKKTIKDVLGVLGNDRYGTCAFACAVHKKSFPNDDPMEIAFEELCNRFDHQLRRMYASTKEKSRGMIVLDKTAYETPLQRLAKGFRRIGTRWGVVKNIVEVPLFVDSRASRIVQLADHVAYAVFRRYQAADTSYLDVVLPKFDADGGKIHGLVHKQSYDANCLCPACMSRRIA